ncbi:MAG: hypothetical protein RLY66_688 [Candidatus Parcubacteria bacterium]|jgi:hypothetical protein
MNIDVLQAAIIFAAPCWIANMTFSLIVPLKRVYPAIARIDKPLDMGGSLWGQRVFGDSRNYAGLTVAIVLALCAWLFFQSGDMAIKILFTFVGAVLGSFIKRRIGCLPGKKVIVLDQLDYMFIVGGIWYFFGWESGATVLVAMLITLCMQPVISYGAFFLGLKDKPY